MSSMYQALYEYTCFNRTLSATAWQCNSLCICSKSAFRESDPDKSLQANSRQTCYNFSVLGQKGTKWRRKRWAFLFLYVVQWTRTSLWLNRSAWNSGKKSLDVLYWTLIEEFWKFSLSGVILPPNRHFPVALTGLRVTGLQVTGYVFRRS